jgi:hypothetical protein
MRNELVIGLILVALLIGFMEYRNAPVEQAIRDELPPRLRACDATISEGTHYGNMTSPRCYFFKTEHFSDKGKQ